MSGYLNPDKHNQLIEPPGGWHDTGDIVTIDSNGFVTIAGRAKRFAKIAGEMVSLLALEAIASSLWPEVLNAAIIKKCPKKGEQIILFSEALEADKAAFIKEIKDKGQSELLVPYQIHAGSKIPILSSGKIDYVTLEKEALEQ